MLGKNMVVGNSYNFTHAEIELKYLGFNLSGNGYWHQFEKVTEPGVVWSELQSDDLTLIEEFNPPTLVELAIERAIKMAELRTESKFWSSDTLREIWVSKYSILDNPYDRKAHKKEHIAWHNAFRNERKLMGKGIM